MEQHRPKTELEEQQRKDQRYQDYLDSLHDSPLEILEDNLEGEVAQARCYEAREQEKRWKDGMTQDEINNLIRSIREEAQQLVDEAVENKDNEMDRLRNDPDYVPKRTPAGEQIRERRKLIEELNIECDSIIEDIKEDFDKPELTDEEQQRRDDQIDEIERWREEQVDEIDQFIVDEMLDIYDERNSRQQE